MVKAGRGALIVTGNTSALRGRARFAGFAPTKAAQRILAESMARDLGPQGVHVAYLVIDAVIDVPWARELHADKADDFFIQPHAIADEVFHLAQQDRSAWTFHAEVRPYHEVW
jgi:NAD(P)-dependent dehydrogenase (short-subunit alcohol dehydrogenase family)